MTTTTSHSNDIKRSPDELMNQLVNAIASVIVVRVREQVAAEPRPSRSLIAPSPKAGYMTVPEAAEYLRCKPQRIYNLLYERQIDRYRDGGRVLIRRDELESWITGASQASAGARSAGAGRRRST